MRPLTETLAAAQRKSGSRPAVKVVVTNVSGGAVRQDWERLYQGSEEDCYHALAVAGDDSLIRVRLTPLAQAGRLYCQRVVDPGPGSSFSTWSYMGQYSAIAVAAAALQNEVSIAWIRTNREIRRVVSTDNGASWGSPELIDYTPAADVQGLAAAYRPGGDLALFFIVDNVLYVKVRSGGVWQSAVSWDKTMSVVDGVAAARGTDWDLLVTGQDASGKPGVWSLMYGDGGEAPVGTWSALVELATAPVGGDFTYAYPFLDKHDVFRSSWQEKFSGIDPLQRPFFSHTLPGHGFAGDLWREPSPLDIETGYGLALAHGTEYAWSSCPSGVWCAGCALTELDVSSDVSLLCQTSEPYSGSLEVALCNDDGRYTLPGQGGLASLVPGCRLRVSPGYYTADGMEYSDGLGFRLESLEHVAGDGRASLVLHGKDSWAVLSEWKARQQFRWNRSGEERPVGDMLAFVLARAGIRLVIVSASNILTGFYPDFTISPGDKGYAVVSRLLACVPDIMFCEDEIMYVVHPLEDDAPAYSYGSGHRIVRSQYVSAAAPLNRILVEGCDAVSGERILVESVMPSQTGVFPERVEYVGNRNVQTVSAAGELGRARLRKAALAAVSGSLVVPVNCGQQLYDVVSITDPCAGVDDEFRRIFGVVVTWNPARGEYSQKLKLGAV